MNLFLKILPVGTLVYVFSPVDILSLNPVDDAFVIWIGTTLFVELCTPQVVEEHMQALRQIQSGQWKDTPQSSSPSSSSNPTDEIIDGEYFEPDARDQTSLNRHRIIDLQTLHEAIRLLSAEGWTQKRIAAEFGVTQGHISGILSGRTRASS